MYHMIKIILDGSHNNSDAFKTFEMTLTTVKNIMIIQFTEEEIQVFVQNQNTDTKNHTLTKNEK